MSQRLTIYKNFTFEASHVLPKHPGQCSRLHGHSWKLTVGVSGPVNPETGFVVDYGTLSNLVKHHVVEVVDHQHLGCGDLNRNDSPTYTLIRAVYGYNFYPSSENLVVAFARILGPLVQELGGTEYDPNSSFLEALIQLEEVSLDETCTCRATWRRNAR